MKKVKMFALMLLAGAAIFSSCKKDEETGPAPTITFTNNVSSYEIDFATQPNPYTVTFTVTISAEEEINAFTAKMKEGTTTTNITPAPTGFSGKTSFSYNYSGNFTPTMTYPIELTFSVTDKADQTTTKTFTVTKKTAAATTPLAYENTSGVIWNAIGANLGGWDLGANAGVSGSSTLADLYNTTLTTSTDAWLKEWGSKTGAKFVKLNSFDYANATVEAATSAYTAGTELTLVTPATGDIYITKIKGGTNYAVIKVGAITETPSPANGGDNLDKIEFSYKKLTSTTN